MQFALKRSIRFNAEIIKVIPAIKVTKENDKSIKNNEENIKKRRELSFSMIFQIHSLLSVKYQLRFTQLNLKIRS